MLAFASSANADIAQLVEQVIRNDQVVGSNPTIGSSPRIGHGYPNTTHRISDRSSDARGLVARATAYPGGWIDRPPGRDLAGRRSDQRLVRWKWRRLGKRALLSRWAVAACLHVGGRTFDRQGTPLDRSHPPRAKRGR